MSRIRLAAALAVLAAPAGAVSPQQTKAPLSAPASPAPVPAKASPRVAKRAAEIAGKAVRYASGALAPGYFESFDADKAFAAAHKPLVTWALEVNWNAETTAAAMELLGTPLSAEEKKGLSMATPRPDAEAPVLRRATEIAAKSARYVRGYYLHGKGDRGQAPAFSDYVSACRFYAVPAQKAATDQAVAAAAGGDAALADKAKALLDCRAVLGAAKAALTKRRGSPATVSGPDAPGPRAE